MEFFGFDIGGTEIKWAAMKQNYEITARGSLPTPQTGAEDLLDVLFPLAGCGRYAGIGVSVPGYISDGVSGIVRGGGHLRYLDGFPLGAALRERCETPVYVENDGKCCAVGEYEFGALRGSHIGVVLNIGTGIGGGIVIDGTVLKGSHAFAGEFSFILTGPEKNASTFGLAGGWQNGLMRRIIAEKGLPRGTKMSGFEMFDHIKAGDPAALRALDGYAGALALQIYNLQAIIDPDVFAIGGGIGCEPALIDAVRLGVRRLIGDNPMKIPVPNVVPAATGKDSNLLGAVCALRKNLVNTGDQNEKFFPG